MKTLWKMTGRVLGYLSWPAVYVVIKFTTRTKVLIVCGEEVLLVKGWMDTGTWSCSGGGLHKDENPADGAGREIKEEIGIVVKNTDMKPLGVFRQTKGFRCKFYGYYVELKTKPPLKLQAIEISEARWVDTARLKNLSTQQHVQLLLDAWQKQR